MARLASFYLDDCVFENKWPLLVDVARKTDGVPRRRRSKLFPDETSVRVMAIRALHQSFFHAVVKGHVELCLLV
jgi:hypothetical protein